MRQAIHLHFSDEETEVYSGPRHFSPEGILVALPFTAGPVKHTCHEDFLLWWVACSCRLLTFNKCFFFLIDL